MSEAQDSKKRNKKRYGGGQRSKRYKGSRELEVGMQGILITCNMNERKCTAEAFNLLNEYADKLYGPENVSKPNFTKPNTIFSFRSHTHTSLSQQYPAEVQSVTHVSNLCPGVNGWSYCHSVDNFILSTS